MQETTDIIEAPPALTAVMPMPSIPIRQNAAFDASMEAYAALVCTVAETIKGGVEDSDTERFATLDAALEAARHQVYTVVDAHAAAEVARSHGYDVRPER